MTVHRLKTWSPMFDAVRAGQMTFQLRKNDRDFQPGDLLVLEEWDPGKGYSTRREYRRAGWISRGGQPGFGVMSIAQGYCVISLLKGDTAAMRREALIAEAEAYGETVNQLLEETAE